MIRKKKHWTNKTRIQLFVGEDPSELQSEINEFLANIPENGKIHYIEFNTVGKLWCYVIYEL